jgi:hypothetical protein
MASGSNIEFAENTLSGGVAGQFRIDGGVPTFSRTARSAGVSALTYGATITTTVVNAAAFTINATNGTAFTISNPLGVT